jgi:hypothetical protein
MFVSEFFIALIFAFIFSMLLVTALGWEYPNRPGLFPSFIVLFLLLMAIIWAGGVWVRPYGPTVYEVPWLGFMVIGLIATLLIAALIPPKGRTRRVPVTEGEAVAGAALGLFFWILMLILAVVIIVYYFL